MNSEEFQKAMDANYERSTGKRVQRAIIKRHGPQEYHLLYDGRAEGIYKTADGAKKRTRTLTPKSKGKLRWMLTLQGTWEARVD